MKLTFILVILLLCFNVGFAQNEQSPIVEKDITYKNWIYKNIRSGDEVSLRELAKGKKLVAVVYFAPWCPNWKHDAPMLSRLYDKYKENGFQIIAVGEYDTVSAMQSNLEKLNIMFPTVYESESRGEKQKTLHYDYRKSTGDTRGWGSPWYVFLEPATFETTGDVLTKRTSVINGEMVESEGEKFIRKKLGLPDIDAKVATADNDEIEVCDSDIKAPNLKRP